MAAEDIILLDVMVATEVMVAMEVMVATVMVVMDNLQRTVK